MDIPLTPNSITDSERGTVTVIASQWGNDNADRGPVWFVALLMHYEAPFYEVVKYTLNDNGYWDLPLSHGTCANINEALTLYAANGGDN